MLRRLVSALLLSLLFSGCSAVLRQSPELSLAELLPLEHRNHFVFVWQQIIDGRRVADGLHVEHVTKVSSSDYEVLISRDGIPTARLLFRRSKTELSLVEEDDLAAGVGMRYRPPLVQLATPINAEERVFESTATAIGLANDEAIATYHVTQSVRLSLLPEVQSFIGDHPRAVGMEAIRTLHSDAGDLESHTRMVLVPGIGELRSEARALARSAGDVLSPPSEGVLRRELGCAIVNAKSFGDCTAVSEHLHRVRTGE